MPWQIRPVRDPEDLERRRALQVGDAWLEADLCEGGPLRLSPRYQQNWAHRRLPIVVRLPGPIDFCVDLCAWRDGVPYGEGWNVSGEIAQLTLDPSVNLRGLYHGWIRGGVISEDVEGRRYDVSGRLLQT